MTRLPLSDQQASAFHSGRLKVVFVEMKPQPADHPWEIHKSHQLVHKMLLTNKGWYCKFWHRIDENPEIDGEQWIKLPYRPGEVCFVGETWRWSSHEDGEKCVCYKADNICQCRRSSYVPITAKYLHWHSPITLSEKLSRAHIRIVEIRPVEVEKIDEEDAFLAGFNGPQPTYQAGEIGETGPPSFLHDFFENWRTQKRGPWAWCLQIERA